MMVCEQSQYAARSANKADVEFLYQESDLTYKIITHLVTLVQNSTFKQQELTGWNLGHI